MMLTRIARMSRAHAFLLLATVLFVLPTAAPVRANTRTLALGTIEKGDNLAKDSIVTFTISTTSGKRLIINAIDVDEISVPNNPAAPPEVSVDCPTIPGVPSLRPYSGNTSNSQAIYCKPQSSPSSSTVTVTVTLKGVSDTPVNYAVFAEDLEQSTGTTVGGLNFAGVSLNARTVRLYSLKNTDSSIETRNLAFAPEGAGAYRMAASFFREDGSLRCGTFRTQVCDLYDRDYSDYYLAIINAGDIPYTYTVVLNNP